MGGSTHIREVPQMGSENDVGGGGACDGGRLGSVRRRSNNAVSRRYDTVVLVKYSVGEPPAQLIYSQRYNCEWNIRVSLRRFGTAIA